MERALEEYAAFLDGTKTRRWGPPEAGGAAPGADYEHEWERIVCHQNPEIDRRMERLVRKGHRCYAPLLWRLLDLYYRRGLCYEACGWEIVAARIGMPAFRWRDDRDKRRFERLLDVAVEQLWLAASDR